MNYYALDEALAMINGDPLRDYSIEEMFNDFNDIGSITEGIDIKASGKAFWEKIKAAFIKLKDKIIEIIGKIKKFFLSAKSKFQRDRMKKSLNKKIEVTESAILSEAVSKKYLESHECSMVNTMEYERILKEFKPESYNDKIVYAYISDDAENSIKEKYDKILYTSDFYDFYLDRSEQIRVAMEGMDKAQKIVDFLEKQKKTCEDDIKQAEDLIKTFEKYNMDSSSSKQSKETSQKRLTEITTELRISLKFFELASKVHTTVFDNNERLNSMSTE